MQHNRHASQGFIYYTNQWTVAASGLQGNQDLKRDAQFSEWLSPCRQLVIGVMESAELRLTQHRAGLMKWFLVLERDCYVTLFGVGGVAFRGDCRFQIRFHPGLHRLHGDSGQVSTN